MALNLNHSWSWTMTLTSRRRTMIANMRDTTRKITRVCAVVTGQYRTKFLQIKITTQVFDSFNT